MRVVVDVEPHELTALVHVLEAAGLRVSILADDDGTPEARGEVRVVARHESGTVESPFELAAGDLVIDLDAREVRDGPERLELTAREFDLLHVLVRHADQVLSRHQLVDQLWSADPVTPNAVEARISSLRRKLGPRHEALIETVRGAGYVFRTNVRPGDEGRGSPARLGARDRPR